MNFDMNQCKKGDKLICRDGTIVEYYGLVGNVTYPHEVKYEGDYIGTRTNTGRCYSKEVCNKDIIGFYKEEKDMNTFDIKDLKTGQRVTTVNGSEFVVITNSSHTSYDTTISFHYKNGTSTGWDTAKHFKSEIVKVEDPDNIQKVLCVYWGNEKLVSPIQWTTVWEKPVPLTPEEIKQQELQAKYDAAKKELEELGKALGAVK